jgi:hypothetical protein
MPPFQSSKVAPHNVAVPGQGDVVLWERFTSWKWWKPIAIIMLSVVTLMDQAVDMWLLLKYAREGARTCAICFWPMPVNVTPA